MSHQPTETLKLIKEAMGGGLDLGVYTLIEKVYSELQNMTIDPALIDGTYDEGLAANLGTITTQQAVFEGSVTWNAGAVTFTGLKLNVTDTASAAASLLMDLQVGGASKAAVTKAGAVRASDGIEALPGLSFVSAIDTGFLIGTGGSLRASVDGADHFSLLNKIMALASDLEIRWNATVFGGGTDIRLVRDSAGALRQDDGTDTAQAYRIYGTRTDASNYERLALSVAGGVAVQTAGTGGDDINLPLTPAGLGDVTSARHYRSTANAGTPGTGVTAVEYGDGRHHTTVLTLTAVAATIGDGAALAGGAAIYTLPAGAVVVHAATINAGLTLTTGTPTTDQPELGLGTVQGAGVQATLGDVDAGCENIAGPVVADDIAGTPALISRATGLAIEAADDHVIYLNYADTWEDVDDTAATLDGTVTIEWTLL